jgi:hypothetical protein
VKPNLSYWSIEQLPGVNENYLNLLRGRGINTTEDLLRCASSLQGKQKLANQLQLKVNHINKWVAMADLARVPSVGCQHCGLILHGGIASVEQLAITPVARLHKQILRLHVSTMQRRDMCPSVEQVQVWVRQAQMIANR